MKIIMEDVFVELLLVLESKEYIKTKIKWNMGFKRFLLRGLDKVDLEWGLLYFALNIKRMNNKDIAKNN